MPAEQNRKLAAILFADIVGYTALMQTNEQESLNNLHKFKRAFEAHLANKNELALAYIDSAYQHTYYTPRGMEVGVTFFDKTLLLTSIYEEQNKFEEAITYFENLPAIFGYEFIAGYSTYKLSQWYEKVGSYTKALDKCNLLIDTYQNCDEKYKPWVEDVKERKERLVQQMN